MGRAPRDRLGTSGKALSATSWTGDAGEPLFAPAVRSALRVSDERRIPNSRGNGRPRDTTCFGAVARLPATFRDARSDAGPRIMATTFRTTVPGPRAAPSAEVLRRALTGGRGTRAALRAFSQRAVDVRASAITTAVATKNPTTVSVSEATAGHPRCGRRCSGSRSSAAAG
jgi:hypothetical protein